MTRAALVVERLGREVTNGRKRPVDGEQDLADGDGRSRPGEARAPARPTVGVDEPGAAELGEDVLQEVLRDVLGGGDLPGTQGAAGRGGRGVGERPPPGVRLGPG